MDIFAITGPTGAGKTTIVDAICYALYGRVPRHDGTSSLIHHEKESMSVELEFEASGGAYRVHRGINLDKKGKRTISPVQLEQLTEDGWKPIEGRVKGVDQEIERIVGLDYRSFTVCVLLPQGRFQEFLAGEKKDRRQVLTDLLDIGIYQQMMTIANGRGRDLQTRADEMGRRLQDDYANATPEALEDVRSEIVDTRERLALATAQREALTLAVGFAESVVGARRRQQERLERLRTLALRIEEAEALARDGQDRLESLQSELAAAISELASVPYDRERQARLERAFDKLRDFERVERDLAGVRNEASDRAALEKAEAQALSAAAALAQAEAATADALAALEEAQLQDAAAHLRAGLKPGDKCPVCGGTVSTTAAAPEAHLAQARTVVAQKQAAAKAARDALAAMQAAVEREKSRLESAAKDLSRLEAVAAQLDSEIAATLPQGMKKQLPAVTTALEEQRELHLRHEELASRGEGLRARLAELQPKVASSQQDLAGLKGQALQLQTEAAEADEEAEGSKRSLLELARELEWDQVRGLIAEKQQPNQLLATMLRSTQDEERSLTGRIATLERDELLIGANIEKAAKLLEEQIETLQRADLFKELGRLLGAPMFQTFVMEEAMEALAETATSHLETIYPRFGLTVGEGEFKAIDHWQADQVRPATTLSGGETFAASLALALALSERVPELRNSAAHTLDSLFLDEGFGTLDPEALTVVIDALETLRSEERLVGIITHVPELARRIETRIEVQKAPEGSSVLIVGA